jgi:peptidoglycan/xylan/chitin deacetylase (PgdA/CDA1 family)
LASALLLGAFGCSSDDPDSDDIESGVGAVNPSAGGAAGAAAAGDVGGAANAAAGAGGATGEAEYPTPDKLVALTFDDGPDATLTAAVLDKLEQHQVPASFFLIGQNITEAARPVLERAATLGGEFENHSFGFASLTGLTPEEIETSVNDTNAAIEAFTNTSPVFFRPPNLAIDQQMYDLIDLPFAGGIVGGDFPAEFGGNPTAEAVTSTVLGQVQDGSIILLHDVQPALDPQPTPTALDTIIPELKRQGYEFVTLRQLFERRGVDPNSQQDAIWNSVPPAN